MSNSKSNVHRIAISGKARAGKNTVAEMIVKAMELKDHQYKITALANPMKAIAQAMFPDASHECLYGASELRSQVISNKYTDANGNALTYRQFLLDLGAFGRRYNSDIWLNCIVEAAKNLPDISAYIIADIRFSNEFEYFKKSGFHMIRVVRDDYTKINDVSEMEQDAIPNSAFDTVIENNHSMDTLYDIVVNMVKTLAK